jgi:hypothetical protein
MLPVQYLPKSKKNEKWGRAVIDAFESHLGDSRHNSYLHKQINYDLYNGILDPDDFSYVLKPYGVQTGEFPANFQHFDFVSSKLNLLAGEELNRPFNFMVKNTSPKVISKKRELEREIIMEELAALAMGKMQPQQAQKPEKLRREIDENWVDEYAIVGQGLLNYFKHKYKLRQKFNDSFYDVLKVAMEVHYVGEIAGEPSYRLCNPLDIDVIADADEYSIEDAEAVIESRYMSIPAILDEYYDALTPSQVKELEELAFRSPADVESYLATDTPVVRWLNNAAAEKPSGRRNVPMAGQAFVQKVEWKSIQKIGILKTPHPLLGTPTFVLVDDSYTAPKEAERIARKYGPPVFRWEDEAGSQELTHYLINEVWEAVKIGDNIVINLRAKKIQRRDIDNPSRAKLGYIGYIYSARNSKPISFIDRAKPLMYLYDIIYYRTELAFAKNKGPIVLMDLAQLPKSKGINLDQWLYYMEAMNVLFVNSREEGEQNTFNQFQVLNAQMTQFINDHIQMLDRIKQEFEELTGITRQRLGGAGISETATNAERSVVQSTHITEYWFDRHDSVKRSVYEALLDTARVCYAENPHKVISYIDDEVGHKILEFSGPDFAATSQGIFITSSGKDQRTLEALQGLAQAGLQAGNVRFKDIVSIYQKDNIAAVVKDLEKAQKEIDEMQNARAQENAKAQQEANAITAKRDADEMKFKYDELKSRETIEMAKLNNLSKAAEASSVESMVEHKKQMDSRELKLEEEKLAEEKRRNLAEEQLKRDALNKSAKK